MKLWFIGSALAGVFAAEISEFQSIRTQSAAERQFRSMYAGFNPCSGPGWDAFIERHNKQRAEYEAKILVKPAIAGIEARFE